jgi:hypothetical protein
MAVAEATTHRKTRIISVVAATLISLACGTNVSYQHVNHSRMLTACSMPTPRGRPNSPTSYSSRRLRAMSSYAQLQTIPHVHDLTMLGHRCESWHVRLGHTNGDNHGSQESPFGRLDRDDMSVRGVLPHSSGYAILEDSL